MIERAKHDKRNPYLTISMKILRDRRLSSEERDCLIMMLSNSDNWEFSYKGLATQLGLKRETVKIRVQSLVEKGYVSVSYPIGENGKPLPFAKGNWVIREEPIISDQGIKKQAKQCPIPGHQKTGTVVSDSWAPDSGHQTLDTKSWTPVNGHKELPKVQNYELRTTKIRITRRRSISPPHHQLALKRKRGQKPSHHIIPSLLPRIAREQKLPRLGIKTQAAEIR